MGSGGLLVWGFGDCAPCVASSMVGLRKFSKLLTFFEASILNLIRTITA